MSVHTEVKPRKKREEKKPNGLSVNIVINESNLKKLDDG
jgi:hypothetical protein